MASLPEPIDLEMDEDEVDQHLHSILIEQHGGAPATVAVATD